MIDAFLSQVRNIQKYQVTGDEAFLDLSRTGQSRLRGLLSTARPEAGLRRGKGARPAGSWRSFRGYNARLEEKTASLDRGKLSSAEPGVPEAIGGGGDRAPRPPRRLGSSDRIREKIQGLKAMGTRAAVIVQVLIVISLIGRGHRRLHGRRGINRSAPEHQEDDDGGGRRRFRPAHRPRFPARTGGVGRVLQPDVGSG